MNRKDNNSSAVPVNEQIAAAVNFHKSGRLGKAEKIYRDVLQVHPKHPDVLYFLGVLVRQKGQNQESAILFEKAIAVNPGNASCFVSCGDAYRDLGRLDQSVSSYQRALSIRPDFVAAHFGLGVTLNQMGREAEAESHYLKVLDAKPDFVEAHYNLGILLKEQGRIDESIQRFKNAIAHRPNFVDAYINLGTALEEKGLADEAIKQYKKALELNPDSILAHNNLGLAFLMRGNNDRARLHFEQALKINPNFAEAHNNIGNYYKDTGLLEQAEAHYKQALKLNSNLVDAQLNLGGVLQEMARVDEAISCFENVLAIDPDNVVAAFKHCVAQIPVVYHDEQHVSDARYRYEFELKALIARIDLESESGIRGASGIVGSSQPFYLAYQGKDDRELQELYGELIFRIQAANYPELIKHKESREIGVGEPIRVGIVSGFYCSHSNWKIPIVGWIDNLDRDKITLYGYYTRTISDEQTEVARKSLPHFFMSASFNDLCRKILDEDIDILIYPEVGMDPMTIRLASLRLAPVQCTSWGHPETSGLPTIDYYLSSDLMEAEGSERFYSEKLVRLPNISVHCTHPKLAASEKGRKDFGLRDDACVFLCAQSLFKYLPCYDEVFALIAKDAVDCQFVFLSKAPGLSVILMQRLNRVFSEHGLDIEDFVVILPSQNKDDYQALNKTCDVFLDSIGWSGCNTTMEAMAWNLPIVTFPGELMRARHSMAILSMAGITETTAESMDGYVRLAVRMCNDQAYRQSISEKVQVKKHLVYEDQECIKGLERFLLGTVGDDQRKPD